MKKWKKLFNGTALLILFVLWTILVQSIDVRDVGVNGTSIGFATLNTWFHKLTGVHMTIYIITDWLGGVPICICVFWGIVGLRQLIIRKSILKVDADIVFLGIYYLVVIFAYLIFEMIPINYRPILMNRFMEASYPSSTTLLVLSVMQSLKYQIDRRCKNATIRDISNVLTVVFSTFMIIGRLVSGVHWCTDIVGSIMLSMGLFDVYQFSVEFVEHRKSEKN